MREWMKERKWGVFFAALLVILAAVCLIRMAQPVKVWNFEGDQLELAGDAIHFEANVIDGNAPGWYVDNSMEYGEVFAQTPAIDLPAGSYEVTIRYQGEGSGSNYSFASAVDTWRVLLGREGEKLESGRTGIVLESCYTWPVDGFRVKISYGGEGYLILNGIEIHQTRALERSLLFLIAAAAFIWTGFVWLKGYPEVRKRAVWGIGIALAATIPILMPYLYQSYDLPFHLLRIEGIAEGLREGQFPVRIQPQWMNGYGYPVSVFYGDGILALAGILRWIGFPLQLSYKFYVFIINFLTFYIAAYCFEKIVKDEKIALTGGVLYTLAPYRLMNIYVRDAVGEFTAQTFLPLIFVGAWEILCDGDKRKKRGWLLLAAGMTGIIQCHILSCEIVVIMLGITCLVCWKKTFTKHGLLEFGKATAATAALNLFFLIPFLDYMREDWRVNSQGYGGPIQTAGAFGSQLLAVFPNGNLGNFSVVEGLTEGRERTFAVGTVLIFALVLFLANWKKHEKDDALDRLGRYCCISGIVLLFMSTMWFPWNTLYEMSDILALLTSRLQFPWRVLGAGTLVLTVLACIMLKRWMLWNGKQAFVPGIVMLGLTAIAAGYFYESLSAEKTYAYVADVESLGTFELGNAEYLPIGLNEDPENFPEGKIWADSDVIVTTHEKSGTHYLLNCANTSSQERAVELPMTYYRGYVARDAQTGGDILVGSGENCRIRLTLAGNYSGTVRVWFQEPLVWRISEVISLISVICFIVWLFRGKRKDAEEER